MRNEDYIMDKEEYDMLVAQLKDADNGIEIIHSFTDCLLNMMNNDSEFLSVKNNRKQREKIVQFQLDLLEAIK